MKNWVFPLLISLFLVSSSPLKAQWFEVGGFVGITSYHGDLSPVAFTIQESHPAVGAVGRINFLGFLGLKGGAYYGRLSGNDKNAKVEGSRLRNLSFMTNIFELSLQGEIHLFGYNPMSTKKWRRFSPFVFGGVGVFRFNPKARYQGQWVELQPLGTEGQGTEEYPDRKKYSLTQLNIPAGAGFKFSINPRWNLSLEISYRKTFTDYIDDVSTTFVEPEVLIANNGPLSYALSVRSTELDPKLVPPAGYQRGRADKNDGYFFTGLNLTYNILPKNRKGSGCVTF